MPKPARIVQVIATLAAASLCCIASWMFLTRSLGSTDFLVFYSAAKMAVAGQGAAVYDRTSLNSVEHALCPELPPEDYSPYLYPPQALPLLSPLGLLDNRWARGIWLGLTLACLLGSMLLLLRTYRIQGAARPWFITLSLISGPVIWCILIGQFGTVLLLALSLSIWCLKRRSDIAAGAALSLLLFKPHEALPLLLYLAGARRFRSLFWATLWTVLGLLIGFALLGPSYYGGFINSTLANSTNNTGFINSQLGPTLRGVLLSYFGNNTLISATAMTALCIVYVFCFWLGAKMSKSRLWLEAGLLGCLPLGFAFALHFHDYDILLLLPTVAALLSQPLINYFPRAIIILASISGLLMSTPIYLEAHTRVRKDRIANPYFLLLLVMQATQFWVLRKKRQDFSK